MKLARGATSLWVAERRGRVVYSRGGKASAPGVPKAREFKTEAAAQAHLEAERDKRLADGFEMIDADARLDAPFTVDGKPRERKVSPVWASQAAIVRMHVLGGYRDRDAIDDLIEDLVQEHTGTPDGEGGDGLRSVLDWVAAEARAAVRASQPPQPWVNRALDAAFEELERAGIVALQAAGYTQGDGWADCNERAQAWRAQGRAARGGCFFHEQDLERAVNGQGLMLGFGAYDAGEAEHDRASGALAGEIVATLRRHGVDASWNGDPHQRIAIAPFVWHRPAR